MNNKLIAVGVLAIGAFTLLTQLPNSALAYQGDYAVTGPNHTEVREEAMEKVMTSKDYEAWKKLMSEDGRTPGVLRKVDTKEEFDKFAQAYVLGKAGKTAEAQTIRAELGLGNGGGQVKGQGQGQGRGTGNGAGFVDENKNGVCDRAE
jgi:hypothetical protein